MLYNYLKITLRNAARQPFFSLINVLGLSAGMAACWLLTLYFFHEQNYDAFLPHQNRIYVAALDLKMGDTEGVTTNTPPPLGLRLAADYPEVEMTARTFNLGETIVRYERKAQEPLVFTENSALAADATFLKLFGFQMAQGNANALNHPQSIVLTQKAAQKYFGAKPALGESLWVNDRLFKVTGILQDLPTNASLQFDFLLPIADFKVVERFSWSWIWLQVETYVKLHEPLEGAALAKVEAKFPSMIQQYAPAAFERVGQNFEEKIKKGDRYKVRLLPLRKLHLNYPSLDSRLGTMGDGNQVRMFGIVGVFILLLACVNFINLSTARSIKRAREVGVRKALGSSRYSLIAQFLMESSLLSIAAMVLAAFLVALFLPFFNQLTGIEFSTTQLYEGNVLEVVVLLPLLTGLIAGLYPAFYLSGYGIINSLKNLTNTKSRSYGSVRSGLVVFQFVVSIVLMLGSVVVYQQLHFAQQSKLGLQKENVLVINNIRHFKTISEREVFRQKLLQLPEISQASHATFLPSLGSFNDFYEPEQGNQPYSVTPNLAISSFLTDEHLVPTLQLSLVAGRNFRGSAPIDSTSVILNETAVKTIGWKNPIGKWLRYPGNGNQRFQVIGVMRDFHLSSVRTAIEPTALFHESSKTYQTWGSYMAVRLRPGTEKNALSRVEAIWKTTVPNVPFEYNFLDAAFANLYRAETRSGLVLGVFTALALFIGCLGLFALATFTAEQRIKEIGIRKVLGASVTSIIGMISKDFLKLVLVALVIASPIAYYLSSEWLQSFTYRISIEWWFFVAAGLLSLSIAFVTVGYQAIKAAMANPVKSLKTE